MIGKAIGAIIVIIIFLGILYSAGHYQPISQQPSQQTTQEDNTHDKKHKKSQDNNHQKKHKKSEEGNTEVQSNQGQGSEEQSNQGQGSEEQSNQVHSQSDTETTSAGTVNLDVNDFTHTEGPQVYVNIVAKNIGNKDAKNVVVEMTFTSDRGMWLDKKQFQLGDIAAGDTRDYKDEFVVGTPDHINISSKVFFDQ